MKNGLNNILFIALLMSSFQLFADEEEQFVDPASIQDLKKQLYQENDIDTRLSFLMSLGQQYSELNLDSSIKYLQKAYSISIQIDDPIYHIKLTNTMGIVYENIDLAKSAEYYYEALEEVEKVDDPDTYLPTLYLNMGTMHRKTGDFIKAVDFLNKSLGLMREQGDSLGIAECYNNLGTVYMEDSEFEQGLEYWNKGLSLKLRLGDELSAANSLLNLAMYYRDTNEIVKSIDYSNRALDIYLRYGKYERASAVYSNIGYVHQRLQQWHKAIDAYEKAINMSDSVRLEYPKIEAYRGLRVAYYEVGDKDKAREANEKFDYLNNKNIFLEKERLVAEIGTKYEADKIKQKNELLIQEKKLGEEIIKQEELKSTYLKWFLVLAVIILIAFVFFYFQIKKGNDKLKSQKVEIEEKNSQIQQSLGEKEVLLKEIHHRVKNNLEIISSLIDLQSNNISDPVTLRTIKEWQTRLDSIALIHKNLYQSENFSAIQMDEYLPRLTDNLEQIYRGDKNVALTMNIDQMELNIDKAIPLGLIVNELVSNAFKYAFEEKAEGEIVVNLNQSKTEGVSLKVRDDGKGLGPDFKIETGESLGLKLVVLLSRQMNGELNYYSSSGANFELKV